MPAGDATQCRTYAQPGDEAWLVKFTSKNLALGHEEGLCEAVYLQMAEQAGRLYMHSACGLLDADFRSHSLDYSDLIKASRQLCKSPAAGQLQFRRAMFNLFAANQDDHSKNWGFLQADDGSWCGTYSLRWC